MAARPGFGWWRRSGAEIAGAAVAGAGFPATVIGVLAVGHSSGRSLFVMGVLAALVGVYTGPATVWLRERERNYTARHLVVIYGPAVILAVLTVIVALPDRSTDTTPVPPTSSLAAPHQQTTVADTTAVTLLGSSAASTPGTTVTASSSAPAASPALPVIAEVALPDGQIARRPSPGSSACWWLQAGMSEALTYESAVTYVVTLDAPAAISEVGLQAYGDGVATFSIAGDGIVEPLVFEVPASDNFVYEPVDIAHAQELRVTVSPEPGRAVAVCKIIVK